MKSLHESTFPGSGRGRNERYWFFLLTDLVHLGIWPFDWAMHKDLYAENCPEQLSQKRYPKVYAWVARFQAALSAARAANPPPSKIDGAEALQLIANAQYAEPEGKVDETDPLGLKKSQEVEIWPTDSGVNHHDQGKLVALNVREVVISKTTKETQHEIRLHFPRTNYKIQPVRQDRSAL